MLPFPFWVILGKPPCPWVLSPWSSSTTYRPPKCRLAFLGTIEYFPEFSQALENYPEKPLYSSSETRQTHFFSLQPAPARGDPDVLSPDCRNRKVAGRGEDQRKGQNVKKRSRATYSSTRRAARSIPLKRSLQLFITVVPGCSPACKAPGPNARPQLGSWAPHQGFKKQLTLRGCA